MTTSSLPAESGDKNNTNTRALLGEFCPKCKSVEAWHGVIVEPGEPERFACDACGFWLAVEVTKPKPQPKPSKHRRFEFVVEIKNGNLFVDINDYTLFAFERGKSLQLGRIEITTSHAIANAEDAEFYRGLDAGRKNAEQDAVEESAA